MGAQIAGHVANAGLPVLLLDLTTEQADRGIRALEKSSPAALFVPENVRRIKTGSFTADIGKLKDIDWIVEAVVEDAGIKRTLLEQVDSNRKPGAWITTNTSGLSVVSLAEGRSEDFRRHWFGTHFFNPPRYMKLLEVIPAAETDPEVLTNFGHFADLVLGKGVVRAKDTPNFIANRIGVFAALEAMRLMKEARLTIEEVDALTGALIGRPKTATFRTMDMVGLDIFAHVAHNMSEPIPDFMTAMIERKMLGAKTGRGFYKKDGDAIFSLDLDTMEYRPQRRPHFQSLEMIAGIESLPERLKALIETKSPAGDFVKQLLTSTIDYAKARQPEIADNKVSVDRAMRWGFAWEMGPFELADVISPVQSVQSDRAYREDEVPLPSAWTVLSKQPVIRHNAGASLRDLGDGVACLEFHSKMNTIGGDIMSMLFSSIEEVNANFEGLVIGSQGQNFSAGANLMLLMMEAAEGNWDEVDHMVRTFQRATQTIKYNSKPVVAAPFALTLGGGCEFVMAAAHVQAGAETYIGLVEVGAGLIPAGGGTTEMVARASGSGGAPAIREVFANIGLAKVSTSAEHARRLRYLRPTDEITMNPARLLSDAKAAVLRLAAGGYRPPLPAELPVFGEPLGAELKLGIYLMRKGEQISDYEAQIARKLAYILCGGDVTRSATAPEQYFLDLEREAFLSLCGESKTLARMEHLLKKGKVLRN